MKRTDASHHVGNLFQTGNPLTGQRGTRLDHTWLNNVQEELVAPILAAGIDLDGGNTSQLLQAMRRLGLGFPTLAEALAEAHPVGNVVAMHGHAAPGDGGGFVGVVEAADNPLYPGGGRIRPIGREVCPEWWGAPANNTGDAAPALTAAFAYLASISGGVLRAKNRYRFETTAVIADPQDIMVDARGADFQTPNDILIVDCNGRADPFYQDNESRQNFWWQGGYFTCSFDSPMKASALRLFGFRNAGLSEAHFSGFRHAVDFSGKDTLRIRDLKFFKNYIDLHNAPWSPVGGLLATEISGIHHSHGNQAGPALLINEGTAELVVERCSYNLGSKSSAAGVQILRQIVLYVDTIRGTFRDGETIIGTTSGATMTLHWVFTHNHPFRVTHTSTGQVISPVRLLGQDRSKTRFLPGEIVTGSTSGAMARLPSTATHGRWGDNLVDDQPVTNTITIGPGCHFEAGSGADGAKGIWILDLVGKGTPLMNVNIDVGTMGLNGGGAVGVAINAQDVRISGRFSQTTNRGTPIVLGPRAKRIQLGTPVVFSTAPIDLNGCDRAEVAFDRAVDFVGGAALNWFNELALTNGAEHVISLPDHYPKYENRSRGGLHPRLVRLRTFVEVDASATNTDTIRIDFRPEGSGEPSDRRAGVSHHGVPAGSANYGVVEVAPDANGRIRMHALTTAPCKITLSLESLIW